MKNVALVAGGAFLAFRSVELVRQLLASNAVRLSTGEEIFIAVLLNVFITGAFALPGFALATSKLLPGSYYQISNPRRLLFWYNKLGVNLFRQFLLVTFWASKKNQTRYFNGTRAGLANLIYQSKQSEFGHLLPLILIQMVSFIALAKGFSWLFLVSTLINVFGNFYPIPLQRMHRYRISRLQKLNRTQSHS